MNEVLMDSIWFLEEHGLIGYVNFKYRSDLLIKIVDLFDWSDSETNQIFISLLKSGFNILQEVEEDKVNKERQSEEDESNDLEKRF